MRHRTFSLLLLESLQLHVCPLQIDIVDRIINRYSNKGDVVFDPFGGIMTVGREALKMGRKAVMCELNPDYFRDGVGYLQSVEDSIDQPTLFDFYLGEDPDDDSAQERLFEGGGAGNAG